MLIQCPNCLIHYRVTDNAITSSNPVFRCTRCKHVFSLGAAPETRPSEELIPPPPVTRPQEKEENQELSFSFPPPEEPGIPEKTDEETVLNLPAEEQPSLTFAEEETGPSTIEKEGAEEERVAEFFPPEAEQEAVSFPTPPAEETFSTKPYLSLFSLLMLIYFLATVFHASHAQGVEGLLRKVPWIGSSVFRNSHLKRGVVLESLRPGFYRIVGNREVFVLAGVAVNQNAVGVREVRVEGVIYDGAGKEIERQTISIGNPISARIIRDLTAQEVSILQKLNPQKSFEISPEQSREFAIVFLKPDGKEITGFACRVSGAQGTMS